MKLLSFDIEISNVFVLKEGENIEKYAPFYISVASTVIDGGEEILWYSVDKKDKPKSKMSSDKANELLEYLRTKQDEGYCVCAWNGLKFDLKWIGHNAKNKKLASDVALRTYDPMFQFFNEKGFAVGLASVAKAMGINQTKLMNGADAPIEWKNGNYKKVMDYVIGDSQITNKIINEIIKRNKISWITQKGQHKSLYINRLKSVAEVLKDPEPDQSWMDTKMLKKEFHSWMR